MGVVVEYPITVYIDKIGDIFLSENILVSQRTKHMGVLHHFACDYVEDGTIKFSIFLFTRKPCRSIY